MSTPALDQRPGPEIPGRDPMTEPKADREGQFWTLFDRASVAVALLDLSGRVDEGNAAFCEMLGSTAGELAESPLVDLVHPIYKQDTGRVLHEVLSGGRVEAQLEAGLLARDGTLTWSRISLFLARTREGERDYGIAIIELLPTERKVLDAIHSLATTDDLTSLHNRRGFLMLADQQWRLALRKRRELSLIYLDVDGLKSINDSWGHRAGDDAIRRVAEILRSACRETDIVARLGGDEFAILMVEAGDVGVELLRSRIEAAVSVQNTWSRQPYSLRVSLGAAHLAAGEERTIDEMLAEADRRMYADKRRPG